MALVRKDAAMMVKDIDAETDLLRTACGLIKDEAKVKQLEDNIAKLALRDAAMTIAEEVYRIIG